MPSGFGKKCPPLRFLRRMWFGCLLSIARLLFALLRVARLLAVALLSIPGARVARSVVPSLSLGLSWRARGFGGKVGGGHETVDLDHRDLTLDQTFYVPEK